MEIVKKGSERGSVKEEDLAANEYKYLRNEMPKKYPKNIKSMR